MSSPELMKSRPVQFVGENPTLPSLHVLKGRNPRLSQLDHCKNHPLFLLSFPLFLLKAVCGVSKKGNITFGLNFSLQELETSHVEPQDILEAQMRKPIKTSPQRLIRHDSLNSIILFPCTEVKSSYFNQKSALTDTVVVMLFKKHTLLSKTNFTLPTWCCWRKNSGLPSSYLNLSLRPKWDFSAHYHCSII